MNKTFKKLILLFFLVLIWGAFLFYIDREETFEVAAFNSELKTEEVHIDIAYDPFIFIGPEKPKREKCGEFYCYTGQEFIDLYNHFESNTQLPLLSKYIYKNKDVDTYLQKFAENLGYQQRVFADEGSLVSFENVMTYPEVRDAYTKMRNEMQSEGVLLHFVSGYRDSSLQRSIFQDKVQINEIEHIPTGIYDDQIYQTLALSALPGYSKHHSGYAVDFGCGNDYLVYTFAETDCYAWMSDNNFENAKRFGFIPSYPEGVEKQGPNPEPWEFVWIGRENIM